MSLTRKAKRHQTFSVFVVTCLLGAHWNANELRSQESCVVDPSLLDRLNDPRIQDLTLDDFFTAHAQIVQGQDAIFHELNALVAKGSSGRDLNPLYEKIRSEQVERLGNSIIELDEIPKTGPTEDQLLHLYETRGDLAAALREQDRLRQEIKRLTHTAEPDTPASKTYDYHHQPPDYAALKNDPTLLIADHTYTLITRDGKAIPFRFSKRAATEFGKLDLRHQKLYLDKMANGYVPSARAQGIVQRVEDSRQYEVKVLGQWGNYRLFAHKEGDVLVIDKHDRGTH